GAGSLRSRSWADPVSFCEAASPSRAGNAPAALAARVACVAIATPWDASSYDRTSASQQAWAAEVLMRLKGIAQDATVLDIGRGTGRVTEALLQLVPAGRVLAIDRSADMVALARERLGGRAEVWCEDVLALEVEQPVDAIVSTATLHWVGDHD